MAKLALLLLIIMLPLMWCFIEADNNNVTVNIGKPLKEPGLDNSATNEPFEAERVVCMTVGYN